MGLSNGSGTRVIDLVAIGGGTGLSTLLSGLKGYVGTDEGDVSIGRLSAIVAVSDDGGSSGRLRDELQMPPPGDIRNCMVALSEDSHLLAKLFKHRFSGDGDLAGHNFGNLFLAALAEVTGDFTEAVRLSSEILASKGHIYPATVSDVRIAARLTDGTVVRGETNISKTGGAIERLYLEPENCDPHPDALAAIAEADLITVGPGSLFTSLLPPLLVHGVVDAIVKSPAVKIFVCNLMTQPGETDGLTSRRHLEIIREYAPDLTFDYLLVNDREISPTQAQLYTQDGAEQIGVHGSIDSVEIEGTRVIHTDLLDDGPLVRHHPDRLAKAVVKTAV
ncbi:MAG TPA: uridine diphosphate-N-acetylglucosamine-binding protein YvcK [Pyrinomonadaceae bacterium]|nr:uridine diphosphate-N-acetylglucosamine-binding protein YvcK [Pyrinomonadaceae bacterium]